MKLNHGLHMNKTIVVLVLSLIMPATALAEESNRPSESIAATENKIDPYEPYNRFMFNINDKADTYVLKPVAQGYRKVTPKPVRIGVNNFFDNLRDVVSFGSNLLRLDIKRASEDLVRVGVNTTFGLGGLINIANAGGIPDNKNNLGDTFASWGWKNSHYFVYPLTGPSTVRDSVGQTIVASYPVSNAVLEKPAQRLAATVVNGVSTREQLLDLTDSLDDAAIDKYAYTRDIFMQMRNRQLGIQTASESEDIDVDELMGEETTASEQEAATPAVGENHSIGQNGAVQSSAAQGSAAQDSAIEPLLSSDQGVETVAP